MNVLVNLELEEEATYAEENYKGNLWSKEDLQYCSNVPLNPEGLIQTKKVTKRKKGKFSKSAHDKEGRNFD